MDEFLTLVAFLGSVLAFGILAIGLKMRLIALGGLTHMHTRQGQWLWLTGRLCVVGMGLTILIALIVSRASAWELIGCAAVVVVLWFFGLRSMKRVRELAGHSITDKLFTR